MSSRPCYVARNGISPMFRVQPFAGPKVSPRIDRAMDTSDSISTPIGMLSSAGFTNTKLRQAFRCNGPVLPRTETASKKKEASRGISAAGKLPRYQVPTPDEPLLATT